MRLWFNKQPITIRGVILSGVLAILAVLVGESVERIWPERSIVVPPQDSQSASALPPASSTPSSSDVTPAVSLDYPLISPIAIGPGRVDLLRLTNATSDPISVIASGATVIYNEEVVIVTCDEGFCIPLSSFPPPIQRVSIYIVPEHLFFTAPGEPTPDHFLVYPYQVSPGAEDFVSKIAVFLEPGVQELEEDVTLSPFLQLSTGERVEAPPVIAITLTSPD